MAENELMNFMQPIFGHPWLSFLYLLLLLGQIAETYIEARRRTTKREGEE